jgi:hypothetical protein
MNSINRAMSLREQRMLRTADRYVSSRLGAGLPRRADDVCQRESSIKSFAPPNQRRTTMSRKINILSTGLLAITIVSSSFANAQDQNNPLHPSHYVGKTATAAVSTSGGAEQYVDARNPLHPAYYVRGSVNTAWQASAAGSVPAYVDNQNPLHPSFVR